MSETEPTGAPTGQPPHPAHNADPAPSPAVPPSRAPAARGARGLIGADHARFALACLSALVKGRYGLRGGHRPPDGHTVAPDFCGVGVATTADPHSDDAIVNELRALGVRGVRLDVSYGDLNNHVGRLLQRLCDEGFRVTLHVLQPAAAARAMPGAAAREEWHSFLRDCLDRFGARVDVIEACSTINRKRWAGYSLNGFLAAWKIAHDAVRARDLTLAGPSITDFEPPWNIGVLELLRRRNQLPDLHSDNLFSERCTEPERWDHKILGHRLAPLLRFNLIKKARLLARIGADAGVPRLISPSAFWTLPRIARLLPDSEQKQADYLTRYLVLCAASGALERAWWGPLVCHREGLVDDGEHPYPRLERITHYTGFDGTPEDFRRRPAFHALAAFNRLIPGTRYLGRQNRGQALEIHAFERENARIDVVWTTNARAAACCDLYPEAVLSRAQWLDRDGRELPEAPSVITETPVYLCWPRDCAVHALPSAAILPGLHLHAHGGVPHHYYRDEKWHGMVRAATRAEADRIVATIHPEHIGGPDRSASLRHARNAIWTLPHPLRNDALLVVKKPVKHHLHKKLLDRFKPSKARRSWNGASELLRRGIDSPAPVAWFEQRSGRDLTANWYVCEHVTGGWSVGRVFSAWARTARLDAEAMDRGGQHTTSGGIAQPHGGETSASATPAQSTLAGNPNAATDALPPWTPERFYPSLAGFLRKLHDSGVHFRDLSGGNILITPDTDGAPRFSLIDTARAHVFERSLPLGKRLSDLSRACHKLHPEGRAAFMRCYLDGLGKGFGLHARLRLKLHDTRAAFKRRLRRTGLYRLLKR